MMRRPAPSRRPVLQAVMMLQAESFICRRCRTDYTISHEKFDSPYHFHPEIEVILMERSQGLRYVADSIEPYTSGDLVMIGANVPHVFVRTQTARRPHESETSIVLHFRAACFGEDFFARPELRDVRRLIAHSAHGLHFDRDVAGRVAPRLRRLLRATGAGRVALMLDILDQLARSRARPLSTGSLIPPVLMKDQPRLERVLAYVARNYAQALTLAAVGRVAALRPSSFSRWFRRSTSKSFVEYVTEIRLAHAYRMLNESGRTVTEIAFACGFNSLSHFSHRFRAARGMSPNQYRQQSHAHLPAARTPRRPAGRPHPRRSSVV